MDDRIVELIKSENGEGLRLLQQRYSVLIRYIVYGILQSEADAEDCISDIHIKVWHSIESYCPDKSRFATWLTVISRNAALNYLKRKTECDNQLKEDMADTFSVEEEVIRREQVENLKRALSTLSPEERHLFYRKYYYLQQTAQIAAELGATERSVEGRLYRLRKKLQKELVGDFR